MGAAHQRKAIPGRVNDGARPGPSVGFISLGCAKNLVDSEHMASVLRAEGLALAPSPERADVIVINTCSFIGDAKRESIDAILAAGEHKRSGRCRAIVVAGCLTQRYRGDLRAALPEADAFIGLDQLDRIGGIVRRLARGERGVLDVSPTARRLFEPLPARLVLTGGPFAYLKIAEGCNHRCAFCAIPAIRGRQRSRPVPAIVREAEALLARGVRELNLIAQDVTAYGRDRNDGASLPRLLRALGRLGGQFWIRCLYAHPASVSDDLLDAMAAVPQVCRYLDVPVQHSHPDILRAMRRAGSAPAVRALPGRLRAALPGLALRTTCLVGFPGETDAHFADLLEYVREAEFDHLGVFTYSREEDTPAFALPRQVPAAVAARRRAALLAAQQASVRRKARARVGRSDTVLLTAPPARPGGAWTGRTAGQAPEVDGLTFVSRAGNAAASGAFCRVRFTAAAGYDLRATAKP
jgi:ribosomal protein S12 methylthiotransferase